MSRHRQPVSAIALTLAVLAAAACSSREPEPARVGPPTLEDYQTYKVCDAGRAVYLFNYGYNYPGGIAIVDNAPECAQ